MEETEIASSLMQYICEELLNQSDYPLDEHEALITGGLIDSFSLAQIGVFIEQEYGVYLPDNELTVDQMDTVDQMVTSILKRKSE